MTAIISARASYTITINNERKTFTAEPETPLMWVIRDLLGLTGTKYGCGKGYCGACTIHYNGNAIRSCTLQISSVIEGELITIEGLSNENTHPVQQAWIEMDVPQCGYCQPGQIMTAAALLAKNMNPSDDEIIAAMAGNICRCGTYPRIHEAIKLASDKINQ
jgi:aerobic-type carbon monoxide dehydrogenase small subunit (CoxS/CutS family)